MLLSILASPCVMLQTICKMLKQLWEAATKTSTSALQATRVRISAQNSNREALPSLPRAPYGIGSPSCSAVPRCSSTSVAKPCGVPAEPAAGSVAPVTNSQLWEKENATIASRVHLEEIIVLQPRTLTVFALHSRSTIENERGNN